MKSKVCIDIYLIYFGALSIPSLHYLRDRRHIPEVKVKNKRQWYKVAERLDNKPTHHKLEKAGISIY